MGSNSVTFFDPLRRSSWFPPSLCLPLSPLMWMFCPAKHLSAGMKWERLRFKAFASTQCLLWSHLLVLILASDYLFILIRARRICQHQQLKLNYRLGVAQNGGSDDYNQTRGSAIQRCLKQDTLCAPLIENDWEMLNRTLFTHHLVSLRSDWRNAVLQTRSKSIYRIIAAPWSRKMGESCRGNSKINCLSGIWTGDPKAKIVSVNINTTPCQHWDTSCHIRGN